ncbi:10481_t:CDS:2 [Dentiscutata heterogama]|uniref:10481_t:CDS:1 n=1 Tax=Dentiscutata heterogama TaxID=1316150 RepID=A0ACA9M0I4_9GLOM|nr:10481_t:CDS:2 [Dentiscutata heterogama]
MAPKIKARNLKNIDLTDENYIHYLHHHFKTLPLSSLIKKNTCFSNQPDEVHNELINIKNNEEYCDDFYVAARKFINNENRSASNSTDETLINQNCSQRNVNLNHYLPGTIISSIDELEENQPVTVPTINESQPIEIIAGSQSITENQLNIESQSITESHKYPENHKSVIANQVINNIIVNDDR